MDRLVGSTSVPEPATINYNNQKLLVFCAVFYLLMMFLLLITFNPLCARQEAQNCDIIGAHTKDLMFVRQWSYVNKCTI